MDVNGITDALVSHAATLGLFQRVNTFEPTAGPGNGMTCAIWVDSIGPVADVSGLDATSAKLVFMVRFFKAMLTQPLDMLDPELVSATDLLLGAYSGDFDLGSTVKQVDLLGQHGTPLSGQAGYLNMDGKMYRVMTITLPLVINDAWVQVS